MGRGGFSGTGGTGGVAGSGGMGGVGGGAGVSGTGGSDTIDGGPAWACTVQTFSCDSDPQCAPTLTAEIAKACADACGPIMHACVVYSWRLIHGPTETFVDYSYGDGFKRYAYAADGSFAGMVKYSTMTMPLPWTCSDTPGFDPGEAIMVPELGGPSDAMALQAACTSIGDAGAD